MRRETPFLEIFFREQERERSDRNDKRSNGVDAVAWKIHLLELKVHSKGLG